MASGPATARAQPTGASAGPTPVPATLAPANSLARAEKDVGPGSGGGGAAGGMLGLMNGGAAGSGADETPRNVMAGFRKPSEVNAGCVRSSIRVPRDLAGFVSGPVTVKFAVGRDGSAALVQLMTPLPDSRLGDIIRAAITSCRWNPGADAQGNPIRLWVVMPIRFTNG